MNLEQSLSKKYLRFAGIVFGLLVAFLIFSLFRDANRIGDFKGYTIVGRIAWNHGDIYTAHANTWPPLFSLICMPLTYLNSLSYYGVRFLWLLTSLISFVFAMQALSRLILNKSISLKLSQPGIHVLHPLIFVPFLLSYRFILENMTNIQINIFILLAAIAVFHLFFKEKYIWLGVILALIISIKVYPIFIMLYFLFKREFKPVIWTIVFVGVFNLLPLLFFGFQEGLDFYKTWTTEIAPKSFMANHKNQSVFGFFLRLLTDEPLGHKLPLINVSSFEPSVVKKITYIAVGIISIPAVVLFRNKLKHKDSFLNWVEYAIIFALIPILSPISWKAYYIFLMVPYFVLYKATFYPQVAFPKTKQTVLKVMFYISIALNIFTAEVFLGKRLSDYTEGYSAMVIGTLLVIVSLVVIWIDTHKSQKLNTT